jgi:hypothetical protein
LAAISLSPRGLDLALDRGGEPFDPIGSTGRLRQAIAIERSSFERSNGSRWLSLFTTVSSRNWMRSKVVKRAPHPSHCRRLPDRRPVVRGAAVLHLAIFVRTKGQRI